MDPTKATVSPKFGTFVFPSARVVVTCLSLSLTASFGGNSVMIGRHRHRHRHHQRRWHGYVGWLLYGTLMQYPHGFAGSGGTTVRVQRDGLSGSRRLHHTVSTLLANQSSNNQDTHTPNTAIDDVGPVLSQSTRMSTTNTNVSTTTSTTRATTPTSQQFMTAMGTSPRRILLSGLSSTAIALAANFLGSTSKLLEFVPEEVVEASGLDTYYPRGDYKRVRSGANGYTMLIPKEWVADTSLALAKATRNAGSLDFAMATKPSSTPLSSLSSSLRSVRNALLPDAAFGPPGRNRGPKDGTGGLDNTNVSVLVANLPDPTFSLATTLGTPAVAATTLLQRSLAPPGSGRVATLVDAYADEQRHGLYQLEYVVDRGESTRSPDSRARRRAISVLAVSEDRTKLFTMTVVAPEIAWNDPILEPKLRKVAASFRPTAAIIR